MKNSFNSKFTGKSAAAVICFCLAGAAALGIFSYNKASEELTKGISNITENTSQPPILTEAAPEPAENANAVAEHIPMFPDPEAEPAEEEVILEHDAFGGDEANAETQTAPATEAVSLEFTGAAVSPVSGSVLADYSDGELVKSKTLSVWKTHDGIDIAAEKGSAVRSAAEGRVISVSSDPLMGVTVVIDHGSGYTGYYSNLSFDVTVTEGSSVSAGTVIGEVGDTAESEISEEPHLHFGLKKNGSWTDPADMLSGEGS